MNMPIFRWVLIPSTLGSEVATECPYRGSHGEQSHLDWAEDLPLPVNGRQRRRLVQSRWFSDDLYSIRALYLSATAGGVRVAATALRQANKRRACRRETVRRSFEYVEMRRL